MESDPLLERLRSISLHKFSYLARFDLRLYYPIGGSGQNWLLELWLCKKGNPAGKVFDIDLHSLHLTCYGVVFSKAHYLVSLVGPLFLKAESIRDRQWQDLKYEFIEMETGGLFYCRDFDFNMEEIVIEHI